jgi:hypothetical protein
MNYYIYKGVILNTEADLSAKDGIIVLNEEQIQFYIDNPTATIGEIINCELVDNTPTLEQVKAMCIEMVSRNYTAVIDDNFDSVLPPPVWDGFKNGYEKCTAVTAWVTQKSNDRCTKIQAIKDATTIEEVQAVALDFTDKVKPYPAEELFFEIMTNQY